MSIVEDKVGGDLALANPKVCKRCPCLLWIFTVIIMLTYSFEMLTKIMRGQLSQNVLYIGKPLFFDSCLINHFQQGKEAAVAVVRSEAGVSGSNASSPEPAHDLVSFKHSMGNLCWYIPSECKHSSGLMYMVMSNTCTQTYIPFTSVNMFHDVFHSCEANSIE